MLSSLAHLLYMFHEFPSITSYSGCACFRHLAFNRKRWWRRQWGRRSGEY